MANWDFNDVVMTGNLARDAELKQLASGTAVAKFTLAVNGKQDEKGNSKTNFFDYNLWGKTAEAITKYLTKGKSVIIRGHAENHTWTDQEGNKKSKVEFVADRIKFQNGNRPENQNNKPDIYDATDFDPSPVEPEF